MVTPERRVKNDETRIGVDCARFFTRKKTGKNKKMHGIVTHTKKCKTVRTNEIEVTGKLAKAKIMIKARVGIV